MADQPGAPSSGGSFKVFLAGLVAGIVVGAVGAAFLTPILINEPAPVQPVKGFTGKASDLPPSISEPTDERGLRSPPAAPADPTKTEAPKQEAPEAPKTEAPKTEAPKQGG